MESFDPSYTIIIALIVGVIAILFIILACFYCFRSNKSAPYTRTPIIKSNHDDVTKASIINLDKKKLSSDDDKNLLNNQDEEKFKYLGINLSDIPFIDDSRCSSYLDLSSWNPNPYKPLTNTIN